MNKKISGEELLFAVGEMPEQLLEYPAATVSRSIFIKKTTVAASLIVCISVVISFFFGTLNKKFDVAGDHDSSENFSDDKSNMQEGSVVKIPASIRIDCNGSPINPYINANNYLLIGSYTDKSTHIIIEYDREKIYSAQLFMLNQNGEIESEIAKENLSSDDRSFTYKAEIKDGTIIGIRNHQFAPDFNIKFSSYGEYFTYEIIYLK